MAARAPRTCTSFVQALDPALKFANGVPITQPRVAHRRAAHYRTEVDVNKYNIYRVFTALTTIAVAVAASGAAHKF